MANNTNATNIRRLTGIALLAAIIVILQMVATFIRPGLIPVNLVLPTIVIGSAMYGAKAGALLGLWTAASLAVIVGWKLMKVISVTWLTRGAALIMLVLAGTSALAAAS